MGIEETIAGLGHLVDGKLVTTGETFGVVNPATGDVFAQCPAATPALLDEAMAAAQRALPAWAADEQLRRDTIRKMAEAIEANFGLINEVASLEKGATGSGGEAFMGAVFGKHLADAPLPIDILQDDDVKQVLKIASVIGRRKS